MAATRLGRKQRRILLAILKLTPEYKGFLPGEDVVPRSRIYKALEAFRLEERRLCRQSILRLVHRGLIRTLKNRRGTPLFFQLTEAGRKAAEELQRENTRAEGLREALKLLREEGRTHATLNQIRERLWQTSSRRFKSREEHEKYWNKRRLGLTLKGMGIKQRWIGPPGKRVRAYILNRTLMHR